MVNLTPTPGVFTLCEEQAIEGKMAGLLTHHVGSHCLPCPSPDDSSPGIPSVMRCVDDWSDESLRYGRIF
jgi:hypothetical protein